MADTKAKFYHILQILWDTDEEHPKTAAQIGELLDARYGIAAERKSICRDINILRDECGFDINLSADNKAGFYLASRPFEDWELKFLMDAVLSSRALSETDARKLVDKLKRQGSQASRELLAAITPLPPKPAADKRLVKYGIDTVLKAIRADRQISFTYLTFDADKQPTPRRKEAYQVSPYALVRKGDFYYLVCNYSKYDNLSFYRLDRIGRI
ncbi:helix-turn-helix transcriptional regulator, partial [Selenomonas sp.]|uniref:helix-turn-helix transcriptional regulator n=1 Tax=Selenomonas sp. TaxID=2053611 RepID=UPI002A759FE0